jgi:hypothetical protein
MILEIVVKLTIVLFDVGLLGWEADGFVGWRVWLTINKGLGTEKILSTKDTKITKKSLQDNVSHFINVSRYKTTASYCLVICHETYVKLLVWQIFRAFRVFRGQILRQT